MNTLLRYAALTAAIFLILSASAGCWSRRELNDISIVAGTALDKTNDPDIFRITAQIIRPANIGTPGRGSGRGQEKVFLNVSETGTETFEIIRKMARKVSRRLYWSHNEALIIGEALAREGVRKHLDFFYRDNETRLNVMVFVARGEAANTLSPSAQLESIPAYDLYRLSKIQAVNSLSPNVDLRDFLQTLLSKTTSAVLPVIELIEQEGETGLAITGAVAFKGDKIIGELTPDEIRGYLWITNKVQSGIILIDCPAGEGAASLEIIRSSASITPEIKDGILQFTVKVREEGLLGSQNCPLDLTEPETWSALEKKQRDAIYKEISLALKKAQELNTDIFGFGNKVYRRYPSVWKNIEQDWDSIFPGLEVTIEIQSRLRRSGEITRTIVPE